MEFSAEAFRKQDEIRYQVGLEELKRKTQSSIETQYQNGAKWCKISPDTPEIVLVWLRHKGFRVERNNDDGNHHYEVHWSKKVGV